MRIKAWPAAATVVVAVLAAAACGGDDGGETAEGGEGDGGGQRAAYVTALAPVIGSAGDLSDEDRDCVGGALVDAIGVDQLAEAISPEEITEAGTFDPVAAGLQVDEEVATAFYDGFSECVDVRQLFLDGLAAEQGLGPEAVECVDGVITDDQLRTLVVASMLGGDAAVAAESTAQEYMVDLAPCLGQAAPAG